MKTKTTKVVHEYWTITSRNKADGMTMGHGLEFRTEKAALKVFDRTVALVPHGTRVNLNHMTNKVITITEKKKSTVSVSI